MHHGAVWQALEAKSSCLVSPHTCSLAACCCRLMLTALHTVRSSSGGCADGFDFLATTHTFDMNKRKWHLMAPSGGVTPPGRACKFVLVLEALRCVTRCSHSWPSTSTTATPLLRIPNTSQFILFGGLGEHYSHLDDTWILDTATSTWSPVDIQGRYKPSGS